METKPASFHDLYFSPVRTRLHTRVVNIGDVPLGGDNPVRVQSMTNTDTNDIKATAEQIMKLSDAGCEYARVTAQGTREAENLAHIRKELTRRGYRIPLIADIHFNPAAAETAARIVEKVRINPGNYVERKRTGTGGYTEYEYEEELARIAGRLDPLLKICREYGTAVRIGVNHGSLSDRIISRYGDTPEGMAQSAMEFLGICENAGFHNLVLSMKASNVLVMVAATRLLADKMLRSGRIYPLHLGVTEAGNGEDGIIRSAAGIGALLEDGIGDTIRVSLTGDPVAEIPVAREIAGRYNAQRPTVKAVEEAFTVRPAFDPLTITRNQSKAVGAVGGNHAVQVIASMNGIDCLTEENGAACGAVTPGMMEHIVVAEGSAREVRMKILHSLPATDPLLLKGKYLQDNLLSFRVNAAIDAGSLLIDGFGDAIRIENPNFQHQTLVDTSFSILQATRARITRTEFISCPSCGRTLFDIENVLEKVKEKTGHLKGLKIAVMGCIVNGPGEMADADYGYVGAGRGMVNLYRGREVVRKNIPATDALDALVELIRESGDWHES